MGDSLTVEGLQKMMAALDRAQSAPPACQLLSWRVLRRGEALKGMHAGRVIYAVSPVDVAFLARNTRGATWWQVPVLDFDKADEALQAALTVGLAKLRGIMPPESC